MPVYVLDKYWNHDRSDFHWRILCTVHDNEALGVIERVLGAAGFEFRVREVNPEFPAA